MLDGLRQSLARALSERRDRFAENEALGLCWRCPRRFLRDDLPRCGRRWLLSRTTGSPWFASGASGPRSLRRRRFGFLPGLGRSCFRLGRPRHGLLERSACSLGLLPRLTRDFGGSLGLLLGQLECRSDLACCLRCSLGLLSDRFEPARCGLRLGLRFVRCGFGFAHVHRVVPFGRMRHAGLRWSASFLRSPPRLCCLRTCPPGDRASAA